LKSMKGWWWVRTNHANHNSMWQRFWLLIRQRSGKKIGEDWFSYINQSRGKEMEQLTRHIISSGQYFTSPCSLSMWQSFWQCICYLYIFVFCDWGRRKRRVFFIFRRCTQVI
jgi:hypothetical protein